MIITENLKTKNMVFSILTDIVFILLLFFSLSIIFQGLADNIIGISNVFQENDQEIQEEITSTQGVRNLLSTLPDFTRFYQGIIKWTLAFFLTMYVLISIFQGLAFWLAHQTDKKVALLPYYAKFFGVNLLWLLLSGVIFWLGVVMSVRQYGSFIPLFSQGMINGIIIFLFVILGYFVVHSYAYIASKNLGDALKLTFKSIVVKKHFLPYLGVILALLVGIGVFVFLTNAKAYVGVVFALVVLFPLFYFSRLYLIRQF
jgi:hypothetical protein